MQTQVGIIGGGPSGLCLARLLSLAGIKSVILERHDRAHVEARIRAGILEQGMVDLMRKAQVGARMDREGLLHDGIVLTFGDRVERVDLAALTGGQRVMVYGQTELTRDLYDAVLSDANISVVFQAHDVRPRGFLDGQPVLEFVADGQPQTLACDFIAGCDGYHGASRAAVPRDMITEYERVYPFGWLGLLADTPPVHEELIYSNHERGFALCSMRSHTRSRYYVQVGLTEKVEDWPDDRFWDEIRRRLPGQLCREDGHRASHRKEHRAAAQFRRRAAALRQAVPRRRRRAHRAAHRRQGLEPGGVGHVLPVDGTDRLLPAGPQRPARPLLADGAAPHLGRGALLVVVHVDLAQVQRRADRAQDPARRIRLPDGIDGGPNDDRRELRRAPLPFDASFG